MFYMLLNYYCAYTYDKDYKKLSFINLLKNLNLWYYT